MRCASHPTAPRSAGSLTSTGTRCQSSYQVHAQPIAALLVWVGTAMVVVAVRWANGGGVKVAVAVEAAVAVAMVALFCPALPRPPLAWSE